MLEESSDQKATQVSSCSGAEAIAEAETITSSTSSANMTLSATALKQMDPKLLCMMSNLANNYSMYCQTDLSSQASRLEEFILESVAKLEEFQSLFEMKESENNEWCQTILPEIIQQGKVLNEVLNQRLDTLQSLTEAAKTSLDQLEVQIVQAEQALGMSSSSFRSVFKYFVKTEVSSASVTSLQQNPPPPVLLDVDQFFTPAT